MNRGIFLSTTKAISITLAAAGDRVITRLRSLYARDISTRNHIIHVVITELS